MSLKFKFLANYSILLLAGNLNFKLRIVFLEYFYFGDLKNEFALSEKKPKLKNLIDPSIISVNTFNLLEVVRVNDF